AHRAAWARRMMWADWYGLKPGDRVLHAGAFNWTFTLGTGLIDPWAAGATALIYTGPGDRRVWSEIARRHGPTHFAAVPGIFRQILDADTASGGAFATVRAALTAGEALPPGLAARWQAATGRPLLSALGMSEVSTYVSDRPDGQRALAQRGRRIAILDDATDRPVARGVAGRLAVSARDPGLMLGYWRGDGPVLPLSGDWFLTGDRAIMAADGSVAWVGRSDSLLNAQGYRVAPEEVEAVLLSHPSVADALVVDLPVRADLTILAAFVTPTEDVPVAVLKTHCAQHLAAYKCPREIRFRSALPRNARGKRDRKALVQTEGWSPP
ncbi:MAG: fatty acid--CoA ligase family protein, partial [Pseudomonadota bacterium]